jgi:hypothetical protein
MITVASTVTLHSYAPNNQEPWAEQTLMAALAYGGAAQGKLVTHLTLSTGWFIMLSRISSLSAQEADPLVNLTRFMGMVRWRLQGLSCRSTP